MLEKPLLGAVVAGAGQAGEVDEEGGFVEGVRGRLRGQVEVEGHFAVGGGGMVGELEQFAAEGCDCRFGLDGHGRGRWGGMVGIIVDIEFYNTVLLFFCMTSFGWRFCGDKDVCTILKRASLSVYVKGSSLMNT